MNKNFDWKTYVENYEDLRKANIKTEVQAWLHWIKYGRREGRTFIKLDEFYKLNATHNNNISNILDNNK